MGALPNTDFAELRYALYVEELRQFFRSSGLLFGSPSDILAFNERLRTSESFFDHLSAQVRAILFREGGSMPRAQLLEVLAVAVGGPEMDRPAQHYREPMRQLFAFVTGTMRRPSADGYKSEGYKGRGEVLKFPSENEVDLPQAEPFAVSSEETTSDPEAVLVTPVARSTSPSMQSLLLAVGAAIVVAVLLVLALRSHAKGPADTHAIPAYTPSPILHHAKPSPYGQALVPKTHHHLRPAAAASAVADSTVPQQSPAPIERVAPASTDAQPAQP
jgi:hypothetical protein